jgi:predicted ATP-grasp superfamily ATP-dependent carboligase
VLIKPQQTVVENNGALCRWASVFADAPEVVAAAVVRFGPSIVQALVRGHVVSCGGVAAGGRLLACVVSRYRRTWPPQSGNVCFSETISRPPGLVERVEALVVELGWEGMFELELMEYPDGSFGAIDFNPRAYGSLALAVAAGVPLPALWCGWLLGQRLGPIQARPGVRYRWEDADLRHLRWQLRARGLGRALRVMRPHRGVAHAYFRLSDPAPSLVRQIELARIAASRRRTRTLRTRR